MNNQHDSVNAKVLHTALARMTSDRAIIKLAFNHWLSTLSDQHFDVINTVAELAKYLGLSTQERKVLMVSLHAAAGRSEHELQPVPDYILDETDNGSSVAPVAATQLEAPSKPAVIELTEAYFDLVMSGVRKVDAKDAHELGVVLQTEGLGNVSAAINRSVKASVGDRVNLPASTSEAECQTLCHEFYMLVAEFIGPRQADSVTDRAISGLLDMSAATRYDPRKLL